MKLNEIVITNTISKENFDLSKIMFSKLYWLKCKTHNKNTQSLCTTYKISFKTIN